MLTYEAVRSQNEYIYNQIDTNLNFDMHLHTSFEFIFIKKGSITLSIEGNNFEVTEGNACLILPNQIHAYKTEVYSESYLCVFSISHAYDFYLKTKNKCASMPVFPFSDLTLVDDLCNSLDEYLLKSSFYKVIYLFNRNNTYIERTNKQCAIMEQLIVFTEDNFDKDVTLHDFTERFAYSYNYLSSLINKTLNMNFSTLVNTQRINHALHLIKNTNDTITEIAITCGYDSIRSFNRNFKRFTNKTPGEYRSDSKTNAQETM